MSLTESHDLPTPTDPTDPTDLKKDPSMSETSWRHPVNVGHLVMGLTFAGLVGVWALIQSDTVGGDDIRWLLPIPWVLAGLVGLGASALSAAGRDRARGARQTGWVTPPEPPSADLATTDTTTTDLLTTEPPTTDTTTTDTEEIR